MKEVGTTYRSRRYRRTFLVRGLLSLLILVMPLLSQAAIPHAQARDSAPETVVEMPCHMTADTAATETAADTDNCPHCQSGHLLGPCPCCSVAVATAIPLVEVSIYLQSYQLVVRLHFSKDSLPSADADRLFRPPIVSA